MNFVIDENVSFGLVERLRANGHKVISIAEESEGGLDDEGIFLLIQKIKAVLITRDYHFTNVIRFPVKDTEGIIYIRYGNLRCDEEIELVQRILTTHPVERFSGKLAILSREGIRVR